MLPDALKQSMFQFFAVLNDLVVFSTEDLKLECHHFFFWPPKVSL